MTKQESDKLTQEMNGPFQSRNCPAKKCFQLYDDQTIDKIYFLHHQLQKPNDYISSMSTSEI